MALIYLEIYICLIKPHIPVPELTQPEEGLGIVHLLSHHLCHYISGMDINGADGHNHLSITLGEIS